MWVYHYNEAANEDVFKYYINNEKIIINIFERNTPEYKFAGWIYDKDDFRLRHYIFNNDIDILKLKCLLKAKEMGWDIKEIRM